MKYCKAYCKMNETNIYNGKSGICCKTKNNL